MFLDSCILVLCIDCVFSFNSPVEVGWGTGGSVFCVLLIRFPSFIYCDFVVLFPVQFGGCSGFGWWAVFSLLLLLYSCILVIFFVFYFLFTFGGWLGYRWIWI